MLKNAPIVLLDEATANVDPENEDRLQKAIEALTRDKTIILIAHRLKTIRNADLILVVDKGQIVQRGTHEELAAQNGIYRRFIAGREEAADWKLRYPLQKRFSPTVSGLAADSPLVRGGYFKLPPSDEGGVKSAAFDGGRDVLRG